MPDPRWHRIPESTAEAICAGLDLDEAARMVIVAGAPPSDCIEALLRANDRVHATRVLARALPPALSVKWACECVRKTLANNAPATERDALASAARWLAEPNDANARAAYAAAEAAEFKTPGAWAAVAPLWAGDNLAPPGEPPLAPPPGLYAKAVAGAVLLAAMGPDDASTGARQDDFLDNGIIAAGGAPPSRGDKGKDGP